MRVLIIGTGVVAEEDVCRLEGNDVAETLSRALEEALSADPDGPSVGEVDLRVRRLDSDELTRRPEPSEEEPAAILVIEDHQATLTRLVRILDKEGYRAAGAADGAEGLRLLAAERFDVVLTDMRMPNKSGLDVLRETRAHTLDVEFVMTTGYGSEESVLDALREGAASILKKPIDIEHMLLAVERTLADQRTRRALAAREREVAALRSRLLLDETEALE